MKRFWFTLLGVVVLASPVWATDYGLIIGASESNNPNTTDLISAQHDAENIRNHWLASGMARGNIIYLVGSDASVSKIQRAFQEMAVRAGPADTLYVAFSGHGDHGGIWGWDDFITASDLRGWIEKVRAKNINLFLDSCSACSVDVGKVKGKNVTVLGAVGKDEDSWSYVMIEPNIPPTIAPEQKGLGSFLYSLGFTPEEGGRGFSRADTNQDGRVELAEAIAFMNGYGAVRTAYGPQRQKACLKKHPDVGSGDWWKNLSRGRVTITLRNANGHYETEEGRLQVEWGNDFTIDFDLIRAESDVPTPQNMSIPYGVNRATARYHISGQATFTSPHNKHVETVQSSGTETFSSPRPFYSPHFVHILVMPEVRLYQLMINLPPMPTRYTTTSTDYDVSPPKTTIAHETHDHFLSFTIMGDIKTGTGRIEGGEIWRLEQLKSYQEGWEKAVRQASEQMQERIRQGQVRSFKDTRTGWTGMAEVPLPPVFTIAPSYSAVTYQTEHGGNASYAGEITADWYLE